MGRHGVGWDLAAPTAPPMGWLIATPTRPISIWLAAGLFRRAIGAGWSCASALAAAREWESWAGDAEIMRAAADLVRMGRA